MRAGDIIRAIPMSEFVFSTEDIEYYNALGFKELVIQALQASYLLCSAYMMWMVITLLFNSDSAVVVVLSESMYPGFTRGDILFLSNNRKEYYAGDICVFELGKGEIPIVHRIIDKRYSTKEVINSEKYRSINPAINHFEYMTKGDNNLVNDAFLYRGIDCKYINASHLTNVVYGSFPLVGMITIWVGWFKSLKYIIVGILALDVVFTRDNTPVVLELEQKKVEVSTSAEEKKKKNS